MGQCCALSKSADDIKLSVRYAILLYNCPEEPQQAGERGWQELCGIQQGVQCPTVGKEKFQAQEQGRQPDGKQLCRKRSEGPCGHHLDVRQEQRPVVSWAALGDMLTSEQGRWFFPSTQQWWGLY